MEYIIRAEFVSKEEIKRLQPKFPYVSFANQARKVITNNEWIASYLIAGDEEICP